MKILAWLTISVLAVFILLLALPEPTAKAQLSGEVSFEDYVSALLEDEGVRYIDSYVDTMIDGGYRTEIRFYFKGRRLPMLDKSRRIMMELYSDEKLQTITKIMLVPQCTFVYKDGKERVDDAAKIVMTRAVASSLNWKNISYSEFVDVIKSKGMYWIHKGMM